MAKPRENWYNKHYVDSWPLSPAHRKNDPQTSVESDSSITDSGLRGSLMDKCLWHIQDHPDQTAGEISEALGLNSWQVSKRLSDLKNKGLITPNGTKLFGKYRQQTWKEIHYIPPSPKAISFLPLLNLPP